MRVLVLTDRTPADDDWKGAFAWKLILSLAESQHQVLVFTTADPDSIGITHPRLSIGRPAPGWGAQHLPKFIQGIIMFRPEVIQTFAMKPSKLWPSLTVWPYLNSALRVLPGVKRFSSYFDESDLLEADPSLVWHKGSLSGSAFTPALQRSLERRFQLHADVLPVELELRRDSNAAGGDVVLVPAPVGEWNDPDRDLSELAAYLKAHPQARARINGGWGDLPLSARREGWGHLLEVADRVALLEKMSLPEFFKEVQAAGLIWIKPLVAHSWRHVVASLAAEGLGREVFGPRLILNQGSTANSLSRLFSR
jgi:hypothetical protein